LGTQNLDILHLGPGWEGKEYSLGAGTGTDRVLFWLVFSCEWILEL
jgi:hypothetical protein